MAGRKSFSNKGKSPVVAFRADKKQVKELDRLAKREGLTRPNYMRDVVLRHHLIQCGGLRGTIGDKSKVSGCQQGVFGTTGPNATGQAGAGGSGSVWPSDGTGGINPPSNPPRNKTP